MSYKDFKTYWDQLEICNLNPTTLSGEDCSEHNSWKVKTVNGKYFPTIDISILIQFYPLMTSCLICHKPNQLILGSWIAGESAGGCRNFLDTFASNPQFRIRVDDPDDDDEDNLCTVIISLMQKGRRALRDEGLDTLTIGRFVQFNA